MSTGNALRILGSVLILAAVPLAAVPAGAAVWTNGAGNMTWDNLISANWDTGTWNDATNSPAVFGATGVGTVTIPIGETRSAGSALTFNASSYTLSGGTLNLHNGTITVSNNVTAGLADSVQPVAGTFESPARQPALASDDRGATLVAYEKHPETGDVPIKIAFRLLTAK